MSKYIIGVDLCTPGEAVSTIMLSKVGGDVVICEELSFIRSRYVKDRQEEIGIYLQYWERKYNLVFSEADQAAIICLNVFKADYNLEVITSKR